jgi:GNAT superfamily N-acetyltransferase
MVPAGHNGTMEIRRPRSDEARAAADVWLRSRKAALPAIPPSVHSDDEVRAWFERVVVPGREVWVAVADSQWIVAVLVLEDEWIDQLYVDPRHAGRGIGHQLVDLAKERRPDGLMLWTFQANHGARRFYERLGFTAMEYTDGANEEGAPDVRYEWRPNGASASHPKG